MKIIVFVKQIRFIYAQTGTDPKQNFIGPDDILHIINPLDELAVEEALRIKENYQNAEIFVISLGDCFAEEGLRKCLSMGADKAIHILAENCEKMDAWATAMLLAYSIKNLQFDLILCGKEAIDNHNTLVGPYIAEILRIPYISSVVKLEKGGTNQKVLVQRVVEGGNREIMECRIPALFTVEKGINIPRYPTLPGILKAQNQIIKKLEIKDLELFFEQIGLASNLIETIRLSIPKPKVKVESSENVKLSASDRLRVLVKGGDSEKKKSSKLLEGSLDKIFDEFERMMKENGITFE